MNLIRCRAAARLVVRVAFFFAVIASGFDAFASGCGNPWVTDHHLACQPMRVGQWWYTVTGTGPGGPWSSLGGAEGAALAAAEKIVPDSCSYSWQGGYGAWYGGGDPDWDNYEKADSDRTLTLYKMGPNGCDVVAFGEAVYPTRFRFVGCDAPYQQTLLPGENVGVCVMAMYSSFNCDDNQNAPDCNVGNPIAVDSRVKFQFERDFTSPSGKLGFTRVYASAGWNDLGPGGLAPALGSNWRHTFERAVVVDKSVTGSQVAYVVRPDRRSRVFTFQNGSWILASEGYAEKLTESVDASGNPTGWTYTTPEATETFDGAGRITGIAYSDGATLTLAYDQDHLASVTDDYGRAITFAYDTDGYLSQVTEPGGATHTYSKTYADGIFVLTGVTHPDNTTRSYVYEDSSNPTKLTGIIDEAGVRFATFSYNGGAAVGTQHVGGVDNFSINVGTGVVTDPLGTQRWYGTANVNGITKLTEVDQPCLGCTSSTSQSYINYDSNNNVSDYTDFNRLKTCYAYDLTRNLETARVEGNGIFDNCGSRMTAKPLPAPARKISTQWHPVWRVKKAIAEPLRITTYAFNGDNGSYCSPNTAATALVCSKTVQATLDIDGSAGFAAAADGAPRVWTYAYNAMGRVLSVDGPRTDVADTTAYAYYVSDDPAGSYKAGDLASITNAKGQVTQFTRYDGFGRLRKMVDPNGLETVLDYWPRGWLRSKAVGTASEGYETTSYTYDAMGQLKNVTLPDGSQVTYTYDPAHRLTDLQDGLGNRIHYTLDNIGNRVQEDSYDIQGTLVRTHNRVIDALNRVAKEIGGTDPASQVTSFTYDPDNNLLTTSDLLPRTTTNSYDALNRLVQTIDPFNGAGAPTKYQYDGQSHLTKVTDPAGLSTSYTVNGHGETTAQASPDTGNTVFTYDAASNVKTKIDARGVTAAYQYDELSRLKSITYPDETVTYTYDSCANGIGRLCGISDKTGTIAYAYDVHGRVKSKTQVVDSVTQTIAYDYNAAGQLALVTLPSGHKVGYTYENNRPVSVAVDGQLVLDSVFYEPFGPNGGWRWGNSTSGAPNMHVRLYDKDFRAASITSDLPSVGVQPYFDLQYVWDAQSRVHSVTDVSGRVPAATYGYDVLDRLTSMSQASTSLAYTYDAVGNRKSQATNGATSNYTYFPGTQRLQSVSGAQPRSFGYDNAGNMTSDSGTVWKYGGNNRPTQAGALNVSINALGQRVKKSAAGSTTRFVYDEAGRLWGEYDDAGAPVTETIWLGDLPVAVLK